LQRANNDSAIFKLLREYKEFLRETPPKGHKGLRGFVIEKELQFILELLKVHEVLTTTEVGLKLWPQLPRAIRSNKANVRLHRLAREGRIERVGTQKKAYVWRIKQR